MSRAASLMFAIFAYAIFFATFLYLIVFVGDLSFARRTVNIGPAADPIIASIIDVGLIALFGVQHSVMARQGFKRWWTQFVPPPIERSVYVLATSAVLVVLFLAWRPVDKIVWDVSPITHRAVYDLIFSLFWVGWLTVLISTFLINHFELFGLKQAWSRTGGRKPEPPKLREPFFYRWVRHPIYAGFFLAFWAAPQMTVGHLILAAGMSVYMLIAIRHEERDLVAFHGQDYEDYRGRVGMLVPRFRRKPTP